MRNLRILLAILLIIFCFSIMGETIDLLGFKTVNSPEGYTESIRELFNIELTKAGYDIREIGASNECFDLDCARKVSDPDDFALWGSITGLGEKYIVAIFYYDYKTGEVIHTDRLTSQTFEDVDLVVKRLVDGIVAGLPADEMVTKGNVTETESRDVRRRQNYYTGGFRLGYMVGFPGSYGDEAMVNFQTMGLYEMEEFAVEGIFTYAFGDGLFGDGVSDVGADISLLYIFNQTDFAPYVAGGLGIHWVSNVVVQPDSFYDSYEDEWEEYNDYYYLNSNGLAVNLGGGLLAFQTYNFRLMLDVRYRMVFAGTAEYDYWYNENDPPEKDLGIQHSINITLGISKPLTQREMSCCFW